MNKVILMGNLTRDTELKRTPSGKTYVRAGIAVKRPFSKEKDAVDFFNLVAWEKTAEFLNKWFAKGSRILIEGRLQTNSYEKNGVKVNAVDVLIEQIEFAGNKKAATNDDFDGEPIAPEDTPF